ncbi:hypothetical protein RRG08_004906 [Elysia crispata]|uniref:Sugar phosphate transporter domain-containing protein n=1 Tax=Elysia crispata TaxID=231223 RepID=A0AAE0ZHS9_9GAST|nr:hypothetical protein RRG08_004906 [Elysia crispata]
MVVCSYWLIATTMIFVNKRLMSAANHAPASSTLLSEPETSKAKYASVIPKLKMAPKNTYEPKLSIDDLSSVAMKDYEASENKAWSNVKVNNKNVKVDQNIDVDGKTAIGFVPDIKDKEVETGLQSIHLDTKMQPVLNLSSNSYIKALHRYLYRNADGPGNHLQNQLADTTHSLDFMEAATESRIESRKPFEQTTSRRDISVLVVWAQSVFGLTFLLTLRGLVLVFRLPLKELQHLQLPSMARRGDLDLVLAAVAQTSALIFNNLTLRLINVSFYQIARALTLVFVTLLSACVLRERIAKRVGVACLLMVAGFYVGVDQEVLSQGVLPVGVMYGSIASFFAACYGVLFKRLQLSSTARPTSSSSAGSSKKIWVNLLQREKTLNTSSKNLTFEELLAHTQVNHPQGHAQWRSLDQEERSIGTTATRITATTLQFTYYNYLTCSIALAPAVFGSCQARDFLCMEASRDTSFWCLLILSGMAGIAMSWVSSLQISLTSPLTHNISINTKSVLLTLTAVTWNGETRTGLWWAGNALVLLGVALYTATKLQEKVQLGDRDSSSSDGRPGRTRRLKLPARLAAVAEDVRY